MFPETSSTVRTVPPKWRTPGPGAIEVTEPSRNSGVIYYYEIGPGVAVRVAEPRRVRWARLLVRSRGASSITWGIRTTVRPTATALRITVKCATGWATLAAPILPSGVFVIHLLEAPITRWAWGAAAARGERIPVLAPGATR